MWVKNHLERGTVLLPEDHVDRRVPTHVPGVVDLNKLPALFRIRRQNRRNVIGIVNVNLLVFRWGRRMNGVKSHETQAQYTAAQKKHEMEQSDSVEHGLMVVHGGVYWNPSAGAAIGDSIQTSSSVARTV